MAIRSAFARAAYARRIVRDVLPRTDRELKRWHAHIETIPNDELRHQAASSIEAKRFHAEGGSVYAALVPDDADTIVPLIVALQTIADYLDNLCDRSVSLDEMDFRALHGAFIDAVDGGGPRKTSADGPHVAPAPYYEHHPNSDDGGYLEALVDECRLRTAALPAYDIVRPHVVRLAELYTDLQVYKHGPVAGRVPTLNEWYENKAGRWRGSLHWWEFAAAAGSTLAMFALFAAATNPRLTEGEAEHIVESYFPWICGLHILLDYFIDQAEDVAGGDLNFVSFYENGTELRQRLTLFVRESRRHARVLPDAPFHASIVQGLAGLYLSDEKVPRQRLQKPAFALLRAGGPATFGYYVWCRLRRLTIP